MEYSDYSIRDDEIRRGVRRFIRITRREIGLVINEIFKKFHGDGVLYMVTGFL